MKHICSISDKWVREFDRGIPGEFSKDSFSNPCYLTFCGVLEDLYEQISNTWKAESTRDKNNALYENRILPALKDHNEKYIWEYSKEDFENAYQTIINAGYETGSVTREYSTWYQREIMRLIYIVVYYGAVYGYCDNVLEDTRFQLAGIDEAERERIIVTIRRSIAPPMEKLINRYLEDETMPGERLGFILMWILGLRDADAASLEYGSIRPMRKYKDGYLAWIFTSTERNRTSVKTGGKTKNSGRLVPVPQVLVRYLEKRKQYIKKIAKYRGEETDIEKLRIVNAGPLTFRNKNYCEPSSALAISNAGNILFREIGLDRRQLEVLDSELYQIQDDIIIKDKTPTAYLCRRNYAMSMKALGLTLEWRQYIIGHDIESGRRRSDFADEDMLHEILKRLECRPLIGSDKEEELIKLTDKVISKKGEYGKKKFLIDPGKHKKVKIIIKAKEVNDELRVRLENNGVIATYDADMSAPDYSENADIRKYYRSLYDE